MGLKSSKSDKNIYHISREAAGLTRDAASEKLYISPDRIEKIEMRGAVPHPDEVLAMAEAYKKPALCNYFCSHECEIGRTCVPEIQLKDVSQITLEMLVNLNKLVREKDRLMDITVDGVVHEDEVEDFRTILQTLDKMSKAIDSMKMWVKSEIAAGNISKEDLNV